MKKRLSRLNITSKKIAKFTFLKYPFSIYLRTFNEGYTQKLHVHDFPQVWLCVGGEHLHEVAGETFLCKKGEIVVVPPGVTHSFSVTSGVLKIFCLEMSSEIFFDAQNVKNTLYRLFLPSVGNYAPHHVKLSKKSYAEAVAIFKSLYNKDENNKAEIFASLEKLFSLPELILNPDDAEEILNSRILPVLKAIFYINNNFEKHITIDDMLRITALCRTHFIKYFKALAGSSYSAYLQEVRLAYAFVLIGNSNYPLSHIASLCGFTDAYYMTNCYKKYIGVAPNSERGNVREDFDAVRRRLEDEVGRSKK